MHAMRDFNAMKTGGTIPDIFIGIPMLKHWAWERIISQVCYKDEISRT